LHHHSVRHLDTKFVGKLLGIVFMKGHCRGRRARAGVRHTQALQQALRLAVLAELPVQGIVGYVGAEERALGRNLDPVQVPAALPRYKNVARLGPPRKTATTVRIR
jgi:hypothetical protein